MRRAVAERRPRAGGPLFRPAAGARHGKAGRAVAIVLKIGNLGRHGADAVPVLENLLHDPKDDLANQAARSLAQIGKPAVRTLAEASRNGNLTVSLRALWALSLIGPEAKDAVPTLVKLLDHEQERLRAAALYALGEMGPPASETTEKIVKAMRTRSAMVRYQSVLAMGKIGTVALADLRSLLQDDLPEVRADTACAVGLFGKHAKEAMPELQLALKDSSEEVRAMAVFSLGGMGNDAGAALPDIVKLLHDQDFQVQGAAFAASLSVGAGDPRLMPALREANRKGKWAAPFILKQFGNNPGDAVAPLIKTLQGKDPAERLGAAWALGQIGLPARDAIPELRKALNDPQPQMRIVAMNSIREINQEVFQDENPLLHEWNQELQRQIQAAALKQKRVQQFQASLKDAEAQRFYANLTQLYFVAALLKNVRMQEQLEKLLLQGGPESIPALVHSVQAVADLNTGFT